jgi:hypothetical protein
MNLIDALSISAARIEAGMVFPHSRAVPPTSRHQETAPRLAGQLRDRCLSETTPAGAATLSAMRCSRAVLVRTLAMLGQGGG